MFFLNTSIAQPIVVSYNENESIVKIGNSAVYLEDHNHSLTINQLLSDSVRKLFRKPIEEVPNFGSSAATIWCMFTIQNNSNQDLFIEIRKALLDEIEFFYPDSSENYKSVSTGSKYARSTRGVDDNYFLFKIPNSTKTETYFLRVRSISNISFPLSIGVAKPMFSKHRDEEFLYGLYIGLILTLVLYNLFIMFVARDRNYLYYILYILVSLILYDLSAIGFGAEYLWGDLMKVVNYYVLSDALIGLALLLNLLFLSSFLDLRVKLPTIFSVNRWFIISGLLLVIINLFNFSKNLPLTQLLILVSCFYTLFVIAYAFAKRIRRARFLLLGWTLYLASIIAYELFILGLLPYHPITLNAIIFGSSLEALFFSFALADRIRELRYEKIKAQAETLRLIKNQNVELEKAVHERTQEIMTQNEEMAAQNEELITLQDQIGEQNDDLEKRNKQLNEATEIIEKQHTELKSYAENLEGILQKKASDLVMANKELIKQNNQLQQFSFITAHNLRAPVARVLGLINVLDYAATQEEKAQVIKNIQQTGFDIDQVIKDLALILDIKKGSTENYEPINLLEKIKLCQSLLRNELDKNQANVIVNIPENAQVFGIKAYVESIFYNLMSNSIKYRSPDRFPTIEISYKKIDGFYKLSFRDNGLGIDLSKYEDNLFGMYKRFHFHTEGRGIGLHLVKTQVEAMGGTIRLTSKVNEGTVFEFTLPVERK